MGKISEVTWFQLSKMFDEVLLLWDGKSQSIFCANSESSRSKKGSNKSKNLNTRVDLWTFSSECAQSRW